MISNVIWISTALSDYHSFLKSFLLTPAMLVVVTEPSNTFGGSSNISLRRRVKTLEQRAVGSPLAVVGGRDVESQLGSGERSQQHGVPHPPVLQTSSS